MELSKIKVGVKGLQVGTEQFYETFLDISYFFSFLEKNHYFLHFFKI